MKKLLLFLTLFIGVISFAQNVANLTKDDLKGFRVEKDDFKNATFIYKKGWGFEDRFSPYIVLKDGTVNLRWNIKYQGPYWVFAKEILVLVNNQNFSFPVEPTREVISSGTVQETADVSVDENILKILREIAISKVPARIRYEGEKSSDAEIRPMISKNIGDVLALYDKLNKVL